MQKEGFETKLLYLQSVGYSFSPNTLHYGFESRNVEYGFLQYNSVKSGAQAELLRIHRTVPNVRMTVMWAWFLLKCSKVHSQGLAPTQVLDLKCSTNSWAAQCARV